MSAPALAKNTAGQIEKETIVMFHTSAAAGPKSGQFNPQETVPFWRSFIWVNQKLTSNIERPTSNNVFCQFKKKTEQSESTLRNSEVRLF